MEYKKPCVANKRVHWGARRNKNTQIVQQDARVREEKEKKQATDVTDNTKNTLAEGPDPSWP